MRALEPPPRRGGTRSISLEDIDADYERKGIALGGDDPKKAAYFGQGKRIGPLGAAIAVHRRLWLSDVSMTALEFGKALARVIAEFTGAEPPTNLDSDHLRTWVQASRPVALPDPQYVNTVITALQILAREAGLEERQVSAIGRDWERPSALLARLREADEEEAEWPAEFHPVEPMFRASPAADDQYQGIANLIGDAFTGAAGRDAIVVVVGPPYSGKRRAISKMIQSRCADDNHYIAIGDRELPLFARNVDAGPIEQLIYDIAQFLKIVPSDEPGPAQIDRLLNQIAEKTKRREFAAAYVLAEVPAPRGFLPKLLGRERLERLIRALFDNSPTRQNRLLLSGTDTDWLSHAYPLCPIRTIEQPKLNELAHGYGLTISVTGDQDERADRPFAVLLATLLEPDWACSDEARDSARKNAEAALCLRMKPNCVNTAITQRADLLLLATAIIQQLTCDLGLLDTLEFVALSEDGLKINSLMTARQAGRSEENPTPIQINEDADKLLRLFKLVSRKVLKAGPWPHEGPPDPEQNLPGPLLELLPPFRRIFETAFLKISAREREFRRKNGIIAGLAREQACWQRLRSRERYGKLPFELIRNAQALRRAQITIDSTQLRAASRVDVRSNHILDRLVFSGGHDLHAVTVFRYLYFDVFRDDIDFQHRLSTEFERDDLRLDLLLGFCNPGVPFYVDDEIATGSTLSNWATLDKVLTFAERAELLISVAVTAKRIGAWSVVSEAARIAENTIQQRSGNKEKCEGETDTKDIRLAMLERVFRCEIDSIILTCGPKKHAMSLSAAKEHIEECFKLFKDSPAAWKARVKFQTRLGEVLTLQGKLDAARAVFTDAEEEIIRAKKERQEESDRQWERSPLLGHGARRYLRLLCEMAERQKYAKQKSELLEKAEDLLNFNLRRMVRFPGEGPLLLLDHAWIQRLQGKPGRAESLLDELAARPMITTSMATRVDIDATFARIALDLLDRPPDGGLKDGPKLAKRTRDAISRLLRVARRGDLPLYQAFGEWMAVRWLRLPPDLWNSSEIEPFEGQPEFEGQTDNELEENATRIFEESGYGLHR